MPDNLTPENRLKTMRAVKGKGTKLERSLGAMLAGMKVKGWRKNASDIIGKPDIAFQDKQIAIFIDGCFWHGCPYCNRKMPQTNRVYWEHKIKRNVELAKVHNQQLLENGWIVIRIWEHEIRDKATRKKIKDSIYQALDDRGGKTSMKEQASAIKQDIHQIFNEWITSCTRGKKVSRNTIAVGIVVLDHLRQNCPANKENAVSPGGEIKGARSGLGNVLEKYSIPKNYLKEATTRQVHQDGQRLFEMFEWGNKLVSLSSQDRDELLLELIKILSDKASAWLERQNLKLDIDRRQAPTTWIHMIVENAKSRSGGVVEQHLVGAKLERRYKNVPVPNHPTHAADMQTEREGDFTIAKNVYHVTATPGRNVIQKCAANIKAGKYPILLIPGEQEYKARALAQDEGFEKEITIISIESFTALNIIELATEEDKDSFGVLKEIIQIYNRRLTEVETDLSLQIELR